MALIGPHVKIVPNCGIQFKLALNWPCWGIFVILVFFVMRCVWNIAPSEPNHYFNMDNHN